MRHINTYKNNDGTWMVQDTDTLDHLCPLCHTFHKTSAGYKTRRLARQAIRDYTGATLVGGLH